MKDRGRAQIPSGAVEMKFFPKHGQQARRVDKFSDDWADLLDHAPDWGTTPDADLSVSDSMTQQTRAQRPRPYLDMGRKLELFAAHRFGCLYCGDVRPLVIDHIIPVAAGGSSADWNLAPACAPCNRSKRARPALLWLASRADLDIESILRRWREAGRGDVPPGLC